MSNRTMLEINHDYYPHGDAEERAWLVNMLAYLRSGNPRMLPTGVTFFGMRHHSEPCPLGRPPIGWHNEVQPDRGDSPTIPILVREDPTPTESENDNSKAVGDFTRVLKDQGMLDQDGFVRRD